MIELPEALSRAQELNNALTGKTVQEVRPPSSLHKFCWFNGDVGQYTQQLAVKTIVCAEGFGIFVDIRLTGGAGLCFNDGVNARLYPSLDHAPAKYQLLIVFTDGCVLAFSVAMYGGILCYQGDYDNPYYQQSKAGISPLDSSFDEEYFQQLIVSVKPTLSLKAFLATEQRIPGLGNGVLQDILFRSGLHPKRKLNTLSPGECGALYTSIKAVLADMTARGGRDTEKNIYGQAGGYHTLMSKNTLLEGCPQCGGAITKEAYLGGSVYYCPHCQPLCSK